MTPKTPPTAAPQDGMQESWKPVVGYEGLYEVSDQGNVRSIRMGRRIAMYVDTYGYHNVNLRMNGLKRSRKVHRLVLEAFSGPSKLVVDHVNSVKTDNRLANLQYVTIRENTALGLERLGRELPRGVDLASNIGAPIYRAQIRKDGKKLHLGHFRSVEEASAAYQAAAIDFANRIVGEAGR